MTARETERLAKMEQRQEDMADDIKEIKELLKAQDAKFAKFVEGANKTFYTRVEGRVVAAVFTALVTAISVFFLLKGHIK